MRRPSAARATTALAAVLVLMACSSAPDGTDGNSSESSEPSQAEPGASEDSDGEDQGPEGSQGGADEDGDGAASADDDVPVALTCELADLAGDDPEEAARRFDVELHARLHELADERAEDDRAASARLLEAKNRVERLLAEDTLDGDAIAEALDELAATLADAGPDCS